MSFILYVVVLVVSVSSVMMGLDWLSTPPPPLPKSVQTVPAKSTVAAKNAPAKTPANKAVATRAAATKAAANKASANKTAATAPTQAEPTDAPADEASPAAVAQSDAMKQPNVATPKPETVGRASTGTVDNANAEASDNDVSILADENGASEKAASAAAARCDVQACTARYRSFSPADCTYQPFDGPRRLCTVGNPPSQAHAETTGMQASDASKPSDAGKPSASASCNYDACGAAYRSFDPATCTYQPFDGPRRACTK